MRPLMGDAHTARITDIEGLKKSHRHIFLCFLCDFSTQIPPCGSEGFWTCAGISADTKWHLYSWQLHFKEAHCKNNRVGESSDNF